MSIEFRCAVCRQLLRVPDEAVGKVARCPSCQTEQTVQPPVFAAAPLEANPYAPPLTLPQPEAAATVGRQPVVPTPLEMGPCFSAAWNVYLANVGMCIAVYLAGEFISQVPALFVNVLLSVAGEARDAAPLLAILAVPLMIASIVLSLWLTAGRIRFFVMTARGASADFVELFRGWPSVGRLFLLGLMWVFLLMLAPTLGVILLAVLGAAGANEAAAAALLGIGALTVGLAAYLLLRYGMSVFLIVDRDMRLGEALRTSAAISDGNRLNLFLLGILSMFLAFGGYMACCVGILFTLPLTLMLFTVAYLQMSGQSLASSANRG